MLTHNRLTELLNYNTDTGDFTWNKKSSPKSNVIVGTLAGSIDKHGYRRIWLDNKPYKAQFLALFFINKEPPKTTIIMLDGNRANTSLINIGLQHDFSNFTLNKEELHKVIEYDPLTGNFIRKVHFSPTAIRGTIAGGFTKNGYLIISLGTYREYAHRLAFLYMIGELPEEVDHKDLNPSNNKWDNLRSCTHAENMRNTKLRSDNLTGVKGVFFDIISNKYKAIITTLGKDELVGYFYELEEAKQAIITFRELRHKEFANHG